MFRSLACRRCHTSFARPGAVFKPCHAMAQPAKQEISSVQDSDWAVRILTKDCVDLQPGQVSSVTLGQLGPGAVLVCVAWCTAEAAAAGRPHLSTPLLAAPPHPLPHPTRPSLRPPRHTPAAALPPFLARGQAGCRMRALLPTGRRPVRPPVRHQRGGRGLPRRAGGLAGAPNGTAPHSRRAGHHRRQAAPHRPSRPRRPARAS